MTTTTRQRPSHYDLLGLSPSATSEEIARAFAREIGPSRPHALGGIAQVCAAYETLRDPAKRRAYDESIGIVREPPVKAAFAMTPQRRADYLFAGKPLSPELPQGPAPVAAHAVAQAATLQAPAPQAVAPAPPPAAEPVTGATAAPKPDPVLPEPTSEEVEPWLAELIALREREAPERLSLLELRRPGLVVGGLFAAVALAGGLAGWWSASDIKDHPEAQSEAVALVDRPAEQLAAPDVGSSAPEPTAQSGEDPATEQPRRTRVEREAPERVQATRNQEQPLASVDRFLDESPVPAPDEASLETAADEGDAAAAPEQSRLPLPDRTVARTIERIGYSCGKVASVTPMAGGSSGAFKVTCTSGDSYRAAPIRGRYHFRRIGGG